MLRTTLHKLKKACYSLSLAPRLLRGETRYTPGKFHLFPYTVVRKADKSTESGKDKDTECERCRNLIELIFGPSKPPDTIHENPELPEADLHHYNELHKDKLAEMAVPNLQEHPDAQYEKQDLVYSEPYGKKDDKKRLQENSSDVQIKDFNLHATSSKQTEEQLAQKVETINETPLVEAEKPKIDGFNVPRKEIQKQEHMLSNDFRMSGLKLSTNNFTSTRDSRKSGAFAKVLRKPQIPIRENQVGLKTKEFPRDSPVPNFNELYPAFQMPETPTAMSEDNTDNAITLKSERTQLYDLDKKPLTYSEKSTAELTGPTYDLNQVIIDPYGKKSYDNNEGFCYDPTWFHKYSIRQQLKSEEEYDAATSQIESAMSRTAAQFLSVNQAHNAYGSEPTSKNRKNQTSSETDPYTAFDSPPLEHANETWQYSERLEPVCNPETSPKDLSAPDKTAAEHETIQLSIYINPDPDRASREHTIAEKETYNDFPYGTTTTQESNTPNINKSYEDNSQTKPPASSEHKTLKEAIQFITSLRNTYPPESNAFINDKESYKLDISEPTTTETNETSIPNETLQLFKQSDHYQDQIQQAHSSERSFTENSDAACNEQNESDKMQESIEENSPNITSEETPHSFVPQAVANPLTNSTDRIQTLSAACGALQKPKPDEELPLSEVLKRVRMRNRMKYCQAFEKQAEPETGKCGGKAPLCPPPVPNCCPPPKCPPPCKPACPPPCPPPSPPPCPPPCPPPSPPPCPGGPSPPPCPPSSPCKKFKKYAPIMDLKNSIISLLRPPESDAQKTVSLPSFGIDILERTRPVWANEMSLKLKEIGINLLVAYPYKTSVSIATHFNAENLTLAKDYEPWVPIPSWPIPKKEKKRPFVCPKDGCKLLPPPKLRPACNENPCIHFPKRDSFSITNLFTFSGEDFILFDIID